MQEKNVSSLTFSVMLDKLLKERDRGRLELAKYAGVSHVTVGNWITGSMPSSDLLFKISQFLGVSMEYLISGKQDFDPKCGNLDELRIARQEISELRRALDQIEEIAAAVKSKKL